MNFYPLEHDSDLRRYSRFLTGKTDLDLLQSTYLKAYRYKDTFDGKNLKAWLFTIMKNCHINHLRRKNPFVDTELSYYESLYSTVNGDVIFDTLALEEVNKVIDQLDTIHQDSLRLSVYGYDCYEIAEMTGTKPSTARTRIFTARKKIAKLMEV